ncbi:hypothetical protein AAGF08_11465 [Algoriphagus sp. SE2]|uniref:hypothetical protein n=1 Tax=Algoriphagus sp. SE2 TaxID=3141536 RepID=UPI0031CD6D2E
MKTSIQKIEAQFSTIFKTKSYSGNSDLTLLIEVPSNQFDLSTIGDFIIELGDDKELKLQDMAFRLFDLTEGKEELQSFISEYEDLQHARKNDKTAKVDLKP